MSFRLGLVRSFKYFKELFRVTYILTGASGLRSGQFSHCLHVRRAQCTRAPTCHSWGWDLAYPYEVGFETQITSWVLCQVRSVGLRRCTRPCQHRPWAMGFSCLRQAPSLVLLGPMRDGERFFFFFSLIHRERENQSLINRSFRLVLNIHKFQSTSANIFRQTNLDFSILFLLI